LAASLSRAGGVACDPLATDAAIAMATAKPTPERRAQNFMSGLLMKWVWKGFGGTRRSRTADVTHRQKIVRDVS
jgi:hypothetical protein